MPVRYGFRSRDGDEPDDLDADELLELIADDYLRTGDLEEAMDRLLDDGYVTESGERVEGLRDLMERLRTRRRDLERRADPDGELARYAERLDAIEALEDAELSELLAEAEGSGDERRAEVTRDVVDAKTLQREIMSDRLGERIRQLGDYDFVSSDAREQFDAMVEELKRDVVNTFFERSRGFLADPDPAALADLREMMDAISTMIEQDRRGEELDPGFEEFMARWGEHFPGAESLEDVVRMLAERAAAAEAMFNSMSAEQQSELRGLFDSLLGDMDLDLSLTRLVANLREATPDLDWGRAHRMRGGEPTSFADSADVAERLGELRRLEQLLGRRSAAQALPEVDVDAVRRHLGDDAARHVERLARALRALRDGGFVDRAGGRLELTPKGVRTIGQRALRDLFDRLRDAPDAGEHRDSTLSGGGDREETSRAWSPGEPVSLHLGATLRNALRRSGPGTPVRLHPDDFEVEEYESVRRSSTVVAVDLSLSMAMRDNLVPAKKMVLALAELIRARYPRDYLAVVGFGETARELRLEDVPSLTIDHRYGTNLQHALALSRHLMRHLRGDKQVIVVTDGEPTAHLGDSGEPFFSWPPVRETLERTMAEVLRCTRAGITINVFALDIERSQFPFVEQIARVNGGRTFYTDVDDLGRYAIADFVRHRRAG